MESVPIESIDAKFLDSLKVRMKSPIQLDLNDPRVRSFLANLITPDRIERKTVKQTVMTSVYGVTFIGAKDQIQNRLTEKYLDTNPFLSENIYSETEIKHLGKYLTPLVFESLKDLFHGATKIQNWLAFCAKEIARSVTKDELEFVKDSNHKVKQELKLIQKIDKQSGKKTTTVLEQKMKDLNLESVKWETPLGYIAVQPYRKLKKLTVNTSLQNFSIIDYYSKGGVDVQKQRAAFPPNFIHSLDATHMVVL